MTWWQVPIIRPFDNAPEDPAASTPDPEFDPLRPVAAPPPDVAAPAQAPAPPGIFPGADAAIARSGHRVRPSPAVKDSPSNIGDFILGGLGSFFNATQERKQTDYESKVLEREEGREERKLKLEERRNELFSQQARLNINQSMLDLADTLGKRGIPVTEIPGMVRTISDPASTPEMLGQMVSKYAQSIGIPWLGEVAQTDYLLRVANGEDPQQAKLAVFTNSYKAMENRQKSEQYAFQTLEQNFKKFSKNFERWQVGQLPIEETMQMAAQFMQMRTAAIGTLNALVTGFARSTGSDDIDITSLIQMDPAQRQAGLTSLAAGLPEKVQKEAFGQLKMIEREMFYIEALDGMARQFMTEANRDYPVPPPSNTTETSGAEPPPPAERPAPVPAESGFAGSPAGKLVSKVGEALRNPKVPFANPFTIFGQLSPKFAEFTGQDPKTTSKNIANYIGRNLSDSGVPSTDLQARFAEATGLPPEKVDAEFALRLKQLRGDADKLRQFVIYTILAASDPEAAEFYKSQVQVSKPSASNSRGTPAAGSGNRR